MNGEDQESWLNRWGYSVKDNISFADADTKLGVKTWYKSPVMSQLNFV